ncbi:MAG TPA: RluA family pseudouridine synthase [Candidatus Avacidaminococcus intestinavium]|uniref:Pseudouridine synthase n=1 Tax=Candidatus Avacidaminococcus intestinavium TaxID=2840684 RepID=A0A9D1MRL9_9FIRM|nr:RluA family pseudouridine synthase [Candidatus Avacidaminococcus intestinavium]
MEYLANGDENKIISVEVAPEDANKRADLFLAEQSGFSRAVIQRLISEQNVCLFDKLVKANYKVRTGDILVIKVPKPKALEVKAENIPLAILYEDNDLLVINKARGMVVHPAVGNYSGTMVNALLYHCHDLSGINGVIRPGIVHRLDKDTSGVILVAKNDVAHLSLAEQIKSKEAARTYLTIATGNVKADVGRIETLIGRDLKDRKKMAVVTKNGKKAITDYRVLERFGRYTLVECKLLTGRTHQIRVHLAYLGNPIVGDPKYASQKNHFSINGQALHSAEIVFKHPRNGKELRFKAPLPEDMEKILIRLRNGQF